MEDAAIREDNLEALGLAVPENKEDVTTTPPEKQETDILDAAIKTTQDKPSAEQEQAETETIQKSLNEKQYKAFAGMRKALDEAHKKLKEYEGYDPRKTVELQANVDKLTKDLDARSKRQAELESALYEQDITKHPEFVKNIDEPIRNTYAKIAAYLKDYDLPGELLNKALVMNRKQRMKLFSEDAPVIQSRLADLFDTLEDQGNKRKAALEEWKTNREKKESEFRTTKERELVSLREKLFSESLSEMQSELGDNSFMLKDDTGNEKWDSAIKSVKQNALSVMAKNDPKAHVKAVAQGAMFPVAVKLYNFERQKRVELEKELAKWKKTNVTTKDQRSAPAEGKPKAMSPEELAEQMATKEY